MSENRDIDCKYKDARPLAQFAIMGANFQIVLNHSRLYILDSVNTQRGQL